MTKVRVQLPEGLGLLKDEVDRLQQQFASHLVDLINAEALKAAAADTSNLKPRPKSTGIVKVEVVK